MLRDTVAQWVEWWSDRRVQYWAICLSPHSFARTAHSLAPELMGKRFLSMKCTRRFDTGSTHYALHCGPEQPRIQSEVLGHSLVCSLTCSLRSLPRSWESGWLDFILCFSRFWPIVRWWLRKWNRPNASVPVRTNYIPFPWLTADEIHHFNAR